MSQETLFIAIDVDLLYEMGWVTQPLGLSFSPLVERKKRQYNLLWEEISQPEFPKQLSEVQCEANVWLRPVRPTAFLWRMAAGGSLRGR